MGLTGALGLAPNAFGNQKPMPWRAGANENTTISFSTPVLIEGEQLGAGTLWAAHDPGRKRNSDHHLFEKHILVGKFSGMSRQKMR